MIPNSYSYQTEIQTPQTLKNTPVPPYLVPFVGSVSYQFHTGMSPIPNQYQYLVLGHTDTDTGSVSVWIGMSTDRLVEIQMYSTLLNSHNFCKKDLFHILAKQLFCQISHVEGKKETVAGALSTFPFQHGQEKGHQGRMGHDKISMIVYNSIVGPPSACKLLLSNWRLKYFVQMLLV